MKNNYLNDLANKIRSFDNFGTLARLSDEDLLIKYYQKKNRSLERLFEPLDDSIIFSVKVLHETIAQIIEKAVNAEMNCIFDISKEGFGKLAIYNERRIIILRYLRSLQLFGFENIMDLSKYMSDTVEEGIEMYLKQN
ncbi:MAG: DUF269 domain-containing protein [Calditerrivibrio sp.]|nr:DUF269 domain-containing protein [Calditerrivibrio sp.]